MQRIIAETRRWVERAVIDLNLCPFAKAVQVKGQIRYIVSEAKTPEGLCTDLAEELEILTGADSAELDTTLLIHPYVLTDFLDYNDFLDVADAVLDDLGLAGEIQLASFHPQYQFAGTQPNDIANYTNRSPYPTLHLLREESIDRAVAAIPNAAEIFERNIETLRRLGHEGWDKLGISALPFSETEISMIALHVSDMTCARCANVITEAIKSVDTSAKVEVDIAAKQVRIESETDSERFAAAIRDAGYTVLD